MQRVALVWAGLSALLSLCSGFVAVPGLMIRSPRAACTSLNVHMSEMPSRREFGTVFGLTSLGVLLGRGDPASADMTLISIKRAYFRYVPRIESGRDMFVLKLRNSIESGKWDEVLGLFEKKSFAQEDSQKKALGLDAQVSELENGLITPMEIWITSFAEKGTSPKQRKLEEKTKNLKASLEDIRAAAQSKDKEAAAAAWEQGRAAFNGYIKVANKGLTKQVRQLDAIPDDWKSYTETPKRPQSYFTDSGKAIAEK